MTASNHRSRWTWLVLFPLALGVVASGCNSGSGGSGSRIPNVTLSSAFLEEDGRSYAGPQMETARYGHTATAQEDGRVALIGGTDERFLTALPTAEIFDQSMVSEPIPESLSGGYITTDINGDPISMVNGGRVFHSSTRLPDGNILVTGGSRDILVAEAMRQAEIFDTTTRLFSPEDLQIDGEMVAGRFRHSATLLPNGKVLIVGGQISVRETIIDTNFPPGHPLFQVDVETFPSTKSIEIFDPTTLSFESAVDLGGNPSELITSRGRSDFATTVIGGPDQQLGTSDDIVLFAGGYQTASTLFAPQTKFPQQFNLSLHGGVEYYDMATGITASAAGISTIPRTNGPVLVNLGQHVSETDDGVGGVSNLALLTHGDDNDICRTTVTQSELITVTFSGAGPASGIQFGLIGEPSQEQNSEVHTAFPDDCPTIGRSGAPAVVMPTRRFRNGEYRASNWVVTTGGEWLTCNAGSQFRAPNGACFNEIQGFMMFDPFFDAAIDPPWDVEQNRGMLIGPGGIDLNPTGVVGSWLSHDAEVPSDDFIGYADPENSVFEEMRSIRSLHTMTVVPGVDGIPGTFDDRILIAGGGANYLNNGGEPMSISTEIYVPIDANGIE